MDNQSINTKNTNNFWLVKVPELIFNQIISESNNDFGILGVYEKRDNQGKKENVFKVKLGSDLDSEYDLQMQPSKNFFTFKEKKNKIRAIDTFGKFIASDERTSDRVTLKVAVEEASNKPRVALDKGKGRQSNQGKILPISEHQFIATSDNLQKAMDQKIRKDRNLKKTRKDKEELKREIFTLFEDKKYWTNREIIAKLDQPEGFVKQVLSEICNLIRSGPKKGCYELKQQYVNIQEEDDTMKF